MQFIAVDVQGSWCYHTERDIRANKRRANWCLRLRADAIDLGCFRIFCSSRCDFWL